MIKKILYSGAILSDKEDDILHCNLVLQKTKYSDVTSPCSRRYYTPVKRLALQKTIYSVATLSLVIKKIIIYSVATLSDKEDNNILRCNS